MTLALLRLCFWYVYFKPKPPCEDGSYCARPQSARTTNAALWLGLTIVLLALTIDWWAPWFYCNDTPIKKTLLIGLNVQTITGVGVALALGPSAKALPASTARAQRTNPFPSEHHHFHTFPT